MFERREHGIEVGLGRIESTGGDPAAAVEDVLVDAERVSVLLFALLAIPLALSVERSRSIATAALLGITLLAVFYTVRTTANMFVGTGYPPAALSPWLILIAFGSYGAWQLFRVPR